MCFIFLYKHEADGAHSQEGLKSLMLKMTQSQHVIEELYDSYTKAAVNIISHYGMPERMEKLKELRNIVQNNCVQNKRLKSAESIKNHLLELYNDEDDENAQTNIESIIQEYKDAISQINVDVSNDDKLLEFEKHVEALLDKTGDDENDTDAEMQMSGGYINVIDPISKRRIVDPVKNICGHTYDRDSITQLLKMNKKTRCPVIGCKSKEFVTLSQLRTDIVTKTYLEKNPA